MTEILEDVTGSGTFGRQVNTWKETLPRDSMEQMVNQVNSDSVNAAKFADAAESYYNKMAGLTANKVDDAPSDGFLYGRKNADWFKVPEVLSFPVTEYTGNDFNDIVLLKPHDYTMHDAVLANCPVSESFALTGNYYLTVRQLAANSVVQQVQNDVGDIAFRHALLNEQTLKLVTTPWKVIQYGTGDFAVKTLPTNTMDYTVTIADVATPIIKVGTGCTAGFKVKLRGGDLLSYLGSGFSDDGNQLAVGVLDVNHGADTIPAGTEFLINNAGTVSGTIEIDGAGGSFGGIVGKILTIKAGDTFSVTRDETGNNWFVLGGASGGIEAEVLNNLISDAITAAFNDHANSDDPHSQYQKKSPTDDKLYMLKNGSLIEYQAPNLDPAVLIKALPRRLTFYSINQNGYVSGNDIAVVLVDTPLVLKNNFEGTLADYTLGDLYTILPNNAMVAIYQNTTRIGTIQFTPGSHTPALIQYQASNTFAKGDKLIFRVDTMTGIASLSVNMQHFLV